MDRHLKTGRIKLFYYHKVNGSNPVSSFLITYHKNQYVINTREHLKHIEDCNSINNPAGKNNTAQKISLVNVTKSAVICWKISFFFAVTIPSSGTILVTTDGSNNTWNKKITYTKKKLDLAYDPVAHWKKALSLLPTGAVGKSFIDEMTRFVNCWTYKSEQEQIALKVLLILTALLLQKTTLNSKERKKEKEKEKNRKGKKKENSETYPILWYFP